MSHPAEIQESQVMDFIRTGEWEAASMGSSLLLVSTKEEHHGKHVAINVIKENDK